MRSDLLSLHPLHITEPLSYIQIEILKETILKDYFKRKVTAKVLNNDVQRSHVKPGNDTSRLDVGIISDQSEFKLTSNHLTQLVKDPLNNKISIKNLASIAFALEGSDYFHWDNQNLDGKNVDKVLFAWDNEKINHPINNQNLLLWIEFLETGNYKINK